MNRFLSTLLVVAAISVACLGVNIQYCYTGSTYVATNLNTYVQFDTPAAMIDLQNTSSAQIQFALNCPDASVFTNLYTNNLCGILQSGEVKRIQILNYPISSVRFHAVSGSNNLVYVTAL